MNERSRYRVTGSIFLIAIAVIVLPMIFDGAGAPVPEPPPLPERITTAPVIQEYDEVVPTTDVVERVEALRDEVDEDGFSTTTATRFGEPILQPSNASTEVWAVQAGSFASLDNAVKFRDRLRGAQYEAFISSAKSSGGDLLHKVAVGPLLSKRSAENMLGEIANAFDVTPNLVEMTH